MRDFKNIFVGLILIGYFLCSAPAPAAEPGDEKFTLPESVAMALERSLSLNSDERAIEKAQWEKQKAFKNFLPVLSGTYSYTRLNEAPSITLSFLPGSGQIESGTQDNFQGKLSLTQSIFTGFKLKNAYELSKLGIDVAKVAREQDRLDIILGAKQAYFGILQAEKAIDVADQSIKQFEAHLNVAQNFYKVGMTTKNQVLEAEVNLAQALQAKIRAENLLSLAKANFNTLLRRAIDAQVEVQDILVYKPFGHDFEYCLDQAMQQRPEIKAVLNQIEIARKQIDLARGGYYPTVAVTANHYWRGDTYLINGSEFLENNYATWDVTLGLTWEFWNWLKPRDDVGSKSADLMRAYNGLTQVKDGIQLEVKRYYLSLKEAEKQIAVTQKAIENAEENYRMSEERYKAQVGTSTEVIDASTLLTSARRNYYDALYNYNLAWATLERAMGLGRDRI